MNNWPKFIKLIMKYNAIILWIRYDQEEFVKLKINHGAALYY